MTDSPVIQRVRDLVTPIVTDLELDLYDVEQRGGTMRVTIDTPPGSEAGVDMDKLALATRLISRELDHEDPIPGRYTLEVTSPGVERTLRTPTHFQREIGKTVSIRLANTEAEQRRLEGVLVAADDTTATIRLDGESEIVERVVPLADIDRARTVFVWGPQPKPGSKHAAKKRTAPQSPQNTSQQSTAPQGRSKAPAQQSKDKESS